MFALIGELLFFSAFEPQNGWFRLSCRFSFQAGRRPAPLGCQIWEEN